MDLTITRPNRVICQEHHNADDGSPTGLLVAANKVDDRLSKDNLKFYTVKWVYGGGNEFNYPTISLKVGDIVMTEALGIDLDLGEGKEYKLFDTEHIVAKVEI